MPKSKDLIGFRFGRLVVVDRLGPNKRNLVQWRCQCDCGNETVSVTGNLNSGNSKSCGCARTEALEERNSVDLTGREFGRLTVLRKLGSNRNNHAVWECVCICGEKSKVTTGNLTRGNTLSCGCLRREVASEMGRACKQDNPISSTPEYRRELQRLSLLDPKNRLRRRVSWHIRKAVNSVGRAKPGSTFEMLGYTPHQLACHIERQFTRGMSWDNVADWDIDHIVPISSAETMSDVIALNQLTNLRPMWRQENNAKGALRQSLL